jgi:hypothetical protein
MTYTLNKLRTHLNELAKTMDGDDSVVVIDDKTKKKEQRVIGVFSHHPLIMVEQHGNTVMLTFETARAM